MANNNQFVLIDDEDPPMDENQAWQDYQDWNDFRVRQTALGTHLGHLNPGGQAGILYYRDPERFRYDRGVVGRRHRRHGAQYWRNVAFQTGALRDYYNARRHGYMNGDQEAGLQNYIMDRMRVRAGRHIARVAGRWYRDRERNPTAHPIPGRWFSYASGSGRWGG